MPAKTLSPKRCLRRPARSSPINMPRAIRAPLLRRLRVRRRGGEPRPRSREADLRRRARQRAAALRLAGQRLGLRGGAAAGRHHSRPRPRARRPPDPRPQAELQRQALSDHLLSRAPRHRSHRLRRAGSDRRAGKAKVIIGGASAYPRLWDFARMRQIADKVGAMYIFDMAHIAGLVAGGVHPSPVPHAHITTTTTHKTLRGPRAGLIICGKNYQVARSPSRPRQGRRQGRLSRPAGRSAGAHRRGQGGCVRRGAAAGVSRPTPRRLSPTPRRWPRHCRRRAIGLVSGGTDNHLMLVDVFEKGILGSEAEAGAGQGRHHREQELRFPTTPIRRSSHRVFASARPR